MKNDLGVFLNQGVLFFCLKSIRIGGASKSSNSPFLTISKKTIKKKSAIQKLTNKRI